MATSISPSILKRLDNRPNSKDASGKRLSPQAPALKPDYRAILQNNRPRGGGDNVTPSRTSLLESTDAPRETSSPRPCTPHPYLTVSWFDHVDKVHSASPPQLRRRWMDAPSDWDGTTVAPPRGENTMRTTDSSPVMKQYNHKLLPSFLLRDLDAGAEQQDDLFHDDEYNDDNKVGTRNRWKMTPKGPPPPPRLYQCDTPIPTKLERLSPSSSTGRRRQRYSKTKVSIPDPVSLPYATVARQGMRPDTRRPQSFPILAVDNDIVAREEFSVQKKVGYEKLIREAAKYDAGLAEEHLRNMIIEYYAGSGQAPDGACYNLVLKAYSESGDAEKAEKVLELMWEDYKRENFKAQPNKKIYTSVMLSWQKSDNKYYAPERCEQLLQKMDRLYESGEAPHCKPDLFAYTCCLHCWADSKRNDAVHRANVLFSQMMSRYDKGEQDLQPDNVAYSNLVNCYVNADSLENFTMIEGAEKVFWEMVNQYHNGNDEAAPSTRNFNTILAAHSKSNSKLAAVHASSMIRKWEVLVENGKVTAKPDAYSYSLWLKCWANSPREDAMVKLESSIQHLRSVAESSNPAARLEVIKFTMAIQAFARNNKVHQAHDLLLEMASLYKKGDKDYKIDLKVFHVVLAAWSRFFPADIAVDKASALIDRLWELNKKKNRHLKPSAQTYNYLLFCLQNAKQPRRAQGVLDEMKDFANENIMEPPTATSYGAVLEIWHRSTDPCKNAKISRLTKECMTRFGSVPSCNGNNN